LWVEFDSVTENPINHSKLFGDNQSRERVITSWGLDEETDLFYMGVKIRMEIYVPRNLFELAVSISQRDRIKLKRYRKSNGYNMR
jgi:hypothetical protein